MGPTAEMVRSFPMNLSSNRQKLLSGAATFCVQAGLLGLLLYGLAVDRTVKPKNDTELVNVTTLTKTPKPKPEPVHPERSHRAKEKPAPPNLKAHPTEIAPPPPIIPMPVPPPVVTAPVASNGASSRAGAALRPGPGTGAGGNGNGLGGGGDGDGEGGAPEQITGRLSDTDYPRDLWLAGVQGTVVVRYRVETNGRVDNCQVNRSSGNGELDGITCSLIEKRFRYNPATDGQGRKVASTIVNETHIWEIDDEERRQVALARERSKHDQ